MLEMIINELNSRGYKAEAHKKIKNGVEIEGIIMLTGSNVQPVMYVHDDLSVLENVDLIIDQYERHKDLNFDINQVLDKEFVLSHLYISLQKESNEDIIKKPTELEGIEQYLEICYGEYSIKLTKVFAEQIGLDEEAWEHAGRNTFAKTTIKSLTEQIREMGHNVSDGGMDIIVMSNKEIFKGASAILDKKALKKLSEKSGVNKFFVLPSSVHEMMLIPCDDESKLDMYSNLVKEVNYMQVDPVDRLTDRAYILEI